MQRNTSIRILHFKNSFFIFIMNVSVCVCVCAHMNAVLQAASRNGVMGGCESLDVGFRTECRSTGTAVHALSH